MDLSQFRDDAGFLEVDITGCFVTIISDDANAGMGYISISEGVQYPLRQVQVENVILDIDSTNKVIGIEVFL